MLADMTDLLFDGPDGADITLVLAHGAGAPMDSPFMDAFAQGLGERGIRTVRFEFPYMVERRASGKKRPPDRQPVLLDCWRGVIAQLRDSRPHGRPDARFAVGGKSMGGRMASLLLAEDPAWTQAQNIRALVCLGYPFHAPGRPEKPRTAHLADLALPTLIVQGDRDPMGNQADVEDYTLAPAIRLHWCPDGNHDLTPRKRSGFTQDGNWTAAMDAAAEFLKVV